MSGTAGQGCEWCDSDPVAPSLGTDGCIHKLHFSWVAPYLLGVVLTAGAQWGVTEIGTDSFPVLLEFYFNGSKPTIQESNKTKREPATYRRYFGKKENPPNKKKREELRGSGRYYGWVVSQPLTCLPDAQWRNERMCRGG